RCAITQIKAQEKGIEIDMDMVQLIAGNLETARKLEGFLIKLSSEAKLKTKHRPNTRQVDQIPQRSS
ncbi:MAG: hypothetical protein MUP45_04810, partial [Candidatus Marinimicrobia bacterium]|nr:hypothetical protein [Candidatus Neomarinimicrobiota bacterium]